MLTGFPKKFWQVIIDETLICYPEFCRIESGVAWKWLKK